LKKFLNCSKPFSTELITINETIKIVKSRIPIENCIINNIFGLIFIKSTIIKDKKFNTVVNNDIIIELDKRSIFP